jgi:hypothetical protein
MNLRDQLQAIYDQHGSLTPGLVVDAARDEGSPLHARFEWDDSVAGEAWRRQQAHELIRSVRVVHSRPDKPDLSVRAFHAVRSDDGFAYCPTDVVLADPVLTQVVLADMAREWKQLRERYDQFTEFRALVIADLAIAS